MKTRPERLILILLMALPILWLPSPSFSLSCPESLEGLKGVEVIVEELKSDLENYNISAVHIQKDVETRLQNAGIQVLTKEENDRIQPLRKPYLYIKVNAFKVPWRRASFAFSVDLALNQQVRLRGNPDIKTNVFFSPTWYKSAVGLATGMDMEEIMEVVRRLTEKFISAYQAGN